MRIGFAGLTALLAFALGSTALAAKPAPQEEVDPLAAQREELALELESRTADIQRTEARLAVLEEKAREAASRLDEVRMDVLETEKRLAVNAALLYRLSRHGKALRYLLNAGSGTAFLKRMKTLKKLVVAGLEERRKFGLIQAEAQADLDTLRTETTQAESLLDRLEEARSDLEEELLNLDQALLE